MYSRVLGDFFASLKPAQHLWELLGSLGNLQFASLPMRTDGGRLRAWAKFKQHQEISAKVDEEKNTDVFIPGL